MWSRSAAAEESADRRGASAGRAGRPSQPAAIFAVRGTRPSRATLPASPAPRIKHSKCHQPERGDMSSKREKRLARAARKAARASPPELPGYIHPPTDIPRTTAVPCDPKALAPYRSYGVPDFVERGYYQDRPFTCADCAKPQVWWAARQKWWFEVAKGYPYSTARRCAPCRDRRRTERDAQRAASLAGRKRSAAP